MLIRKIVLSGVVVAISGSAAAQGAFDFDDIPGVNQEPAVAVDINPTMMRFLETVVRGADPEGAAMLTGLRSISLRVYHDENNTRQFNNFIDDVTDELQGSGWLAVVSAQDEGSKVRIHTQMTDQEISGMTVMVTDGTKAIFINIDGTISAEDLGRVMAMMPVEDVFGSLRGMPMPGAAQRGPADAAPAGAED
jgi:hypothetical protein